MNYGMSSEKAEIAGVLRKIDFYRKALGDLVASGCAMTDPEVVKVSQELDGCLNFLRRLTEQANEKATVKMAGGAARRL